MATFDRFDLCEAYLAVEQDWHVGGWLHERPSNVRRGQRRGYVGESTDVQLRRMQFKPGAGWRGFESLTENGKAIYHDLCARYGLQEGGVS